MGENDKKQSGKITVCCKILVNYLIAISIALIVIFALPRVLKFAWPIVVGWIIAMIANPLVRLLERKLKLVRKHGTAIVIVIVLAIIIGAMYFLVYALLKQGVEFAKNFPDLYASVSDTVAGSIEKLRGSVGFLSGKGMKFFDGLTDNLGNLINKLVGDIINSNTFSIDNASNIVKSVAEGILMTVITILLSYFLTAEHDKILEKYHEKMPDPIKKACNTISKCIVSAFGGYFKAQFKIMTCVFIIMSVGFLCMRIDYAILIAFIVAFVDFLPVFGAGAIMWPWCLYEVIEGRYVSAILLFVIYLICQGVRQFLQPKMVGDSIGISPLSTLIFMFLGYRFGGVVGMIIGIPIGMILISFYKEGVFDNLIRGTKILVDTVNEWRRF